MSAGVRRKLIKNPVVDRLAHPSTKLNEDRLARAVMGKRVLLTGASYGIGEATARLLGEAGARLVLVARSEERLAAVTEEIRAAGGQARYYAADLTDPAAVDALLAHIREEEGEPDIFINNAGKSIRRSIELSYDRFHDYQRTMGINYLGPVKLMLGVLPGMRERRDGQIINVSTVGVGFPPAPRWAAYQASKGAFDTFFRSAELEARHDRVLFSSVYLALVYTRMSAPTPVFREGMTPGMTAEEAARLIARAIVERKRVIAPWWFFPTEVTVSLVRRPVARVLSFWFARTDDTRSARIARQDKSGGEHGR